MAESKLKSELHLVSIEFSMRFIYKDGKIKVIKKPHDCKFKTKFIKEKTK